MSMMLFLTYLFIVQVWSQGTPVTINKQTNLDILNAERTFWNVQLLAWDDSLQELAQKAADKCEFNTIDLTATGEAYAAQIGVTYNNSDPDARVGETHAFGTANRGISTNYTLIFINDTGNGMAIALMRNDYDCTNDKCFVNDPPNCNVYQQVIWRKTKRVGCAISNCPDGSSGGIDGPVDYLVCNFITAGNYNGEPTFGDAQVAACAHNFTEPPPPQPPSCSTINCTSSSCASPDKNGSAVCDPVSGEWQFAAGNVGVDQLYTVNCPARITGDFTGSGSITFGVCGKLAVTGVSRITSTDVNIDMAGLDTIADNYYYGPVLSYASGSGPSTVHTYNVFSPYQAMCSHMVNTATSSFVRFYLCSQTPNLSVPPTLPSGTLPDGTSTANATSGTGTAAASGNPPASANNNNPTPTSGGGGGGGDGDGLPWWAIVLIVFACLIAFVVLVAIIIFLIVKIVKGSSAEERY